IVLRKSNGARRHSIKSAPADEPVRIAMFGAHGPLKSPPGGALRPWQQTAPADCDGQERIWLCEIYGRPPRASMRCNAIWISFHLPERYWRRHRVKKKTLPARQPWARFRGNPVETSRFGPGRMSRRAVL